MSTKHPYMLLLIFVFLETDMRSSQSLDARPGSIYDVLDRSPSNRDQKKVMAKKMEPKNTVSVNFNFFKIFLYE